MSKEELFELSTKLSLEDISDLIYINKDRIFVFVGNSCEELCNDLPVCINGSSIQINLQGDTYE